MASGDVIFGLMQCRHKSKNTGWKNVTQMKICKLRAHKPKMEKELHENVKLSIPEVKSSNSVSLIKPDCFLNLKMECFKEKQT